VLDKLAGTWNVKVSMREKHRAAGAGIGAAESSNIEWIFDGRFLEETCSGSYNDAPFIGRGFIGHDNFGKKYEMTWFDNMSTMIVFARAATMRRTRSCGDERMPDLETGKYAQSRWVMKLGDPDHLTNADLSHGRGRQGVRGRADGLHARQVTRRSS
jgi:hypothetical protein